MMKRSTLSLICTLAAALPAFPLHAGEDDTAAYYKGHLSENVGDTIDVDVVIMRALPVDIGEGFFAAAVWTWNDDTNSGGGVMAIVAPADKKDSLLKKYGSSVDWEGRRNPDTKTLRGTLQTMPNPKIEGAVVPYIDMTDGTFTPNDVFGNAAVSAELKSRVPR